MRTAVLLFCLGASGCESLDLRSRTLPDADAAGIRDTYRAFTAAAVTEDFRRLGRFFANDAVWMPHAGPPVHGRPAIEAWFTIRAVEFDHQILELQGRGDLAYTRASFTLRLDLPGSTPCNGSALAVWTRQPGGHWRIARYAQTFETLCSGVSGEHAGRG